MNKREEKLTRVIGVAKRNGYKDVDDSFFTDVQASEWFRKTKWPDLYFSMIFSKSFAFAYFGDDFMEIEDNGEQVSLENFDDPAAYLMTNIKGNVAIPSWQFHLINMVISDDPLEYAYKFADERDINKPLS